MTYQKKVEVVPYDPEWPQVFEHEKLLLENALGSGVCVHHIGSTSVPGLCAKPIIDMIAVLQDTGRAIHALELLGYIYKGELRACHQLSHTREAAI